MHVEREEEVGGKDLEIEQSVDLAANEKQVCFRPRNTKHPHNADVFSFGATHRSEPLKPTRTRIFVASLAALPRPVVGTPG